MCDMIPDSNTVLVVVDTEIFEYWTAVGSAVLVVVQPVQLAPDLLHVHLSSSQSRGNFLPEHLVSPFCKAQRRSGIDQQ